MGLAPLLIGCLKFKGRIEREKSLVITISSTIFPSERRKRAPEILLNPASGGDRKAGGTAFRHLVEGRKLKSEGSALAPLRVGNVLVTSRSPLALR